MRNSALTTKKLQRSAHDSVKELANDIVAYHLAIVALAGAGIWIAGGVLEGCRA